MLLISKTYVEVDFPEYQEDANIIINNSTLQQQKQGWGNNNNGQITKVST
jgi:hypothetical protein